MITADSPHLPVPLIPANEGQRGAGQSRLPIPEGRDPLLRRAVTAVRSSGQGDEAKSPALAENIDGCRRPDAPLRMGAP
jgi:hypothetical protein